LAVVGTYVVALGVTVAATRPWDGPPPSPVRAGDERVGGDPGAPRRNPDEATKGADDRGGDGSLGATPGSRSGGGTPGRESGDGRAQRRRGRRALPRAAASQDALAPALPVPAEPVARLVVPLGRCCSESRAGSPVDAIVLHATEQGDRAGPADLLALARFFRRAGLATHVADDAQGTSIRMVGDDRLAYHATFWNDVTVGIEQMGFSSFTRAQWLARPAQLETTARWVAHWARRYRIPIRRCAVTGLRYDRNDRVSGGTIVRRGVCSHAQLDPRNRDDPGRGYPWDVVLARARALAARSPTGG
jgi:hypothetical protein